MPIYKVRNLKPEATTWVTIEADSPEEAAGEFQEQHDPPYCQLNRERKGCLERIRLCCVEVEGHGEFITRQFRSGIFRKGGIKPPNSSEEEVLKRVAEKLGWQHDPRELVADGWPLEEEYNERSVPPLV